MSTMGGSEILSEMGSKAAISPHGDLGVRLFPRADPAANN